MFFVVFPQCLEPRVLQLRGRSSRINLWLQDNDVKKKKKSKLLPTHFHPKGGNDSTIHVSSAKAISAAKVAVYGRFVLFLLGLIPADYYWRRGWSWKEAMFFTKTNCQFTSSLALTPTDNWRTGRLGEVPGQNWGNMETPTKKAPGPSSHFSYFSF